MISSSALLRRKRHAGRPDRYGSRIQRSKCNAGHNHQSPLEAAWCDELIRRELDGRIKKLEQQVRHNMYLASHGTLDIEKQTFRLTSGVEFTTMPMSGWCSCVGFTHEQCPPGFVRIVGVIPDYEFYELNRAGEWVFITADAKGVEKEEQMRAYKIFELIHGRVIELYKNYP